MTIEDMQRIPLTAEEFTNELEALIVTEKLKIGTKLASERQLSEQYGLGRPAVREALRSLQERGLLTIQPGRGSYVRESRPTLGSPSADLFLRRGKVTARQLARARVMLEGETASLAAENRTPQQLTQLASILDAIQFASSFYEKADLDLAFHEKIAEASGNLVLQIMFGSIRSLSHGTMLRSLSDSAVSERGEPLHRAVFAAIESQDPRAAKQAMVEHLHLAEVMYGPDLDAALFDVLRRRVPNHHFPEEPGSGDSTSLDVVDG